MADPARRILAVSTSRGDARALRAVVKALVSAASVRVLVADIAAPFWSGLPVDITETGLDAASGPTELVEAGHRLARALMPAMREQRSDLLLLHGDRHELLPLAHAAALLAVPLVHLGGGDVTEGAFDDSIRHALTKLAHLHLCTNEQAAERIRQLGEESWRIVVTGEPALDELVAKAAAAGSRTDIEKNLGFRLSPPVGLLTYHPPTTSLDRIDAELNALLVASKRLATVVATHPSADPQADEILLAYAAAAGSREGFHVVPHLGDVFPAVLALADVVLGNSSSGVVEAASFATPVIDVGDRQQGRLRPANVLHVEGDEKELDAALTRVLDPSFRAALVGLVNPYGDGHAAERAASAIAGVKLDGLLRKRFANRTR